MGKRLCDLPADPFPTRIFENTKCLAQPFNKAEVLDKISDFPKEVLMEVTQGVLEVALEVQEVPEVNILKRETMMTFTIKKIKKTKKKTKLQTFTSNRFNMML